MIDGNLILQSYINRPIPSGQVKLIDAYKQKYNDILVFREAYIPAFKSGYQTGVSEGIPQGFTEGVLSPKFIAVDLEKRDIITRPSLQELEAPILLTEEDSNFRKLLTEENKIGYPKINDKFSFVKTDKVILANTQTIRGQPGTNTITGKDISEGRKGFKVETTTADEVRDLLSIKKRTEEDLNDLAELNYLANRPAIYKEPVKTKADAVEVIVNKKVTKLRNKMIKKRERVNQLMKEEADTTDNMLRGQLNTDLDKAREEYRVTKIKYETMKDMLNEDNVNYLTKKKLKRDRLDKELEESEMEYGNRLNSIESIDDKINEYIKKIEDLRETGYKLQKEKKEIEDRIESEKEQEGDDRRLKKLVRLESKNKQIISKKNKSIEDLEIQASKLRSENELSKEKLDKDYQNRTHYAERFDTLKYRVLAKIAERRDEEAAIKEEKIHEINNLKDYIDDMKDRIISQNRVIRKADKEIEKRKNEIEEEILTPFIVDESIGKYDVMSKLREEKEKVNELKKLDNKLIDLNKMIDDMIK